jgi:hypothetical protein
MHTLTHTYTHTRVGSNKECYYCINVRNVLIYVSVSTHIHTLIHTYKQAPTRSATTVLMYVYVLMYVSVSAHIHTLIHTYKQAPTRSATTVLMYVMY